jgi:hypothetical protein
MDAKELRVGNYLLQTNQIDYDTLWFVYKCYPDSVITVGKHLFTYEDEDIKPIPLTEEWLLKFGFDDLGYYGFGIGYFHILYIEDQKNNFQFPISNKYVRVKHVHQLQNLYFALTGEELELI